MALYLRTASSRITLDFPVPDIPVSRTRFTVVSLRSAAAVKDRKNSKRACLSEARKILRQARSSSSPLHTALTCASDLPCNSGPIASAHTPNAAVTPSG